MAKDTTKNGVSKKATDKKVENSDVSKETELDNVPALKAEPTLSQRDESVSDIVAKARENRSKREGYISDEGTDPDGTDLGRMDEETGEQINPVRPADISPTIKVDGETIEVSQAEIDEAGGKSALQKERAAANRLRLATADKLKNEQKEQELVDREAQIALKEAQIAQQAANPAAKQQNKQKPSVQDADADLEATAKKLAEKIYSGEEDQAEEAILAILKRDQATSPNTTDIDVVALTQDVTNKVSWGLEKKNAQEDFARDFPKLNKTPMLRNLVNEETKRIIRAEPNLRPAEVLSRAAKTVSDEFDAELGKSTEKIADDERINRKRTTDQVTGANSRMPSAPDQKALTPSQIVAQMGQSRSGPQ